MERIIFPYNPNGSLIDITVMRKEYAGTYEYLSDCYDLLAPQCLNAGKGRDIKNATADTWYQYGRTQALTAFVDTPKLIVRVLSKEPMYAYDKEDMLIASGGTAGYCAIAESPGSHYDLSYIQAWLNHPYTEKLLRIMGSDFEGGFTARGTYLLKKIPFVELDFGDGRQKRLYEDVVNASRRVFRLAEKMVEFFKRDTSIQYVLEPSCGDGVFIDALVNMGFLHKGNSVTAVEIEKSEIDKLREKLDKDAGVKTMVSGGGHMDMVRFTKAGLCRMGGKDFG